MFPASILTAGGIAAPLVYLLTVVAGGWARPGHSHFHQPVSALFETGAPYAAPISAAFVLYNLLLIAFGTGLWQAQRAGRAIFRPAAAMIVLNGLFGLLIELTPMDPMGTPATLAGTLHLVIAGLLVITCAGAMALLSSAVLRTATSGALGWVTLALLAVMLIAGAVAAMAAAQGWPYLGLAQRITIGVYLIWIFVLALFVQRTGVP